MVRHNFGCRIVQRILEHCSEAQKQAVLDHILRNLVSLCREQYGNYVVQHVLEHGRQEDRSKIVNLITREPLRTTCHKYGSNVVEKALLIGTLQERAAIIKAIVQTGGIIDVLHDRFANYVLQRILDVAPPAELQMVTNILREQKHAAILGKTTFGKQILQKMDGQVSRVQ